MVLCSVSEGTEMQVLSYVDKNVNYNYYKYWG